MEKNNINKQTENQQTAQKEKPKKLGKGLEAIFGDNFRDVVDSIDPSLELTEKNVSTGEISIDKIVPNPYNPRKHFDEEKLQELASSIKENGLMTPIAVKKTGNNNYYIIAGERRYRASKIAGLTTIKAIILDVDDKKMQELALIENIQREDLNPIEEAVAMESLISKHNLTHDELSKILGKSRSYISNQLRLLSLDKKIIDLVLNGKLSYGHVRPLVTLEAALAIDFANKAIEKKWSVRDVENNIKFISLKESKKSEVKNTKYDYAIDLLRNKLKTKVEITNNKIIIKFTSDDQFNRLLERLDVLEKEYKK